jgi:hypothetical protein
MCNGRISGKRFARRLSGSRSADLRGLCPYRQPTKSRFVMVSLGWAKCVLFVPSCVRLVPYVTLGILALKSVKFSTHKPLTIGHRVAQLAQ